MTDDRVNFSDTYVGRRTFTASEQADAFHAWVGGDVRTLSELERILRHQIGPRDNRRYAAYACASYMIRKMQRAGVITYSGKKWHFVEAQK